MGKSIKFLNNLLLDSSSIVHNKITLDSHFNSNVYQLQYATFLPDNTDLNTVVIPGTYMSKNTEHTATMLNVPKGQTTGFHLTVTQSATANFSVAPACLMQELKRDSRTFKRFSNDAGATWSEWEIISSYKIGDIVTTTNNAGAAQSSGATQLGAESPQLAARYGGKWVLHDKEFTYTYIDTTGTKKGNTTAVAVVGGVNGHVLSFRLGITYNPQAYDDNSQDIAQLPYSSMGCTRLLFAGYQMVAGSDGGNGFCVWNINTAGVVTHNDHYDAPVDSQQTYYVYFAQALSPNHMLDSWCNRFHWRKTE